MSSIHSTNSIKASTPSNSSAVPAYTEEPDFLGRLRLSDPILYKALLNDCKGETMLEQVSRVEGKQFMLNLLQILKGSDSALKQRLSHLLPELFNTVFDEATSKLITEQLTIDHGLIGREAVRIEAERDALRKLSVTTSPALAA